MEEGIKIKEEIESLKRLISKKKEDIEKASGKEKKKLKKKLMEELKNLEETLEEKETALKKAEKEEKTEEKKPEEKKPEEKKPIPNWVWILVPCVIALFFFILLLAGITRKPAPPPVPPQEKVIPKQVTFKREVTTELTPNKASISIYGMFENLDDSILTQMLFAQMNRRDSTQNVRRWTVESLKLENLRWQKLDSIRRARAEEEIQKKQKDIVTREATIAGEKARLEKKEAEIAEREKRVTAIEEVKRYRVLITNIGKGRGNVYLGPNFLRTLGPGEDFDVEIPAGKALFKIQDTKTKKWFTIEKIIPGQKFSYGGTTYYEKIEIY